MFRCLTAAAVLVAAGFSFSPAAAAASAAAGINGHCAFTPSSNSAAFRYATDGNYATQWTSGQSASEHIDLTIGSGYKIGGVYFVWSKAPAAWTIYAYEDSGARTSILEGGTEGYLTQYVSIPSEYADRKKFRIAFTPDGASSAAVLAELTVFGPGDAPYYAPAWEPFTGRADLLTIVSHPDDEDLYMGVPAPTYADQGMRCVTVFMTYGSASTSVRRFEAQESAWSLGNRWYPAMGNFPDVKMTTKEAMMPYWPLNDTVAYLVEQIRRYKPSVVVTHDVNGEYGHGAHKLTQYAAALAFTYAADASKYPESVKKYGTWKPGKLYVHLYGSNALDAMSLTATLYNFGGRSVLQVVKDAYNRHASQLPGRSLPTSGPYDMRKFGLYATNLGADAAHRSMFENVTQDAMLRLNLWYIYEVTDRSALARALSGARAKKEADYTPESWAAADLTSAVAAAQSVMDDREAMQAAVNTQEGLLVEAMRKLVAYLAAVRIASPPDRQAYVAGEALDLAGLAVTAVYSDGSERPVAAADVTVSGFDNAAPTAGQPVAVSYADAYSTHSASFSVDILPVDGERIQSTVYAIDRGGRVVSNIAPGTNAERLLAGFGNGPEKLKLFNADGSEYADGAVTTGMTIKLVSDGILTDVLKLSVLGDVSGDGIIDISDILCVRASIVDTYALRSFQIPAADVCADGVIDISDILYIRSHILGTYDLGTGGLT